MDLIITIDVEAHRCIDEISGAGSDSLGSILAVLRSRNHRATFFVDLCEVATWGEPFMRSVCQRISEGGQDLQLHAHPHHISGDKSRWLLSEYSRQDQAKILDYAIEQYVNFSGKRPLAFRAGGFGANSDTLELLVERGVSIDSSLMLAWRGCDLASEPAGCPTLLHGIKELPLTPIIALGTREHPRRIMPLDFNWMPLFSLKSVLRKLRRGGAPAAVLLMHSSSLCARLGSRSSYRRSRLHKFEQLLGYLDQEGFRIRSVDQVAEELWQRVPTEVLYEERSWFLQYTTLFFRSVIGATFKPKFAAFLLANVFMIVAIVIAVFRLL